MVTLADYLILSAIVLSIGIAGIIINRKNVITLLMSLELILIAVNINFVAFARFLDNIAGEVFVFFILTVAASEAAIGLALLVITYRNNNTISIEKLNKLKG